MKFLFPALCWAVLLGGFACAKRPPLHPVPAPAVKPGEPFEEDVRVMPNPKEKILDFADHVPSGAFYFDYDAFALKDKDRAGALALYLSTHTDIVHLEGHASQEGTNDYNLALGARRAQTVRAYLEAAGIPEHRIEWKSFGEENPLTEDPAEYWKNRRVDFFLEDPK